MHLWSRIVKILFMIQAQWWISDTCRQHHYACWSSTCGTCGRQVTGASIERQTLLYARRDHRLEGGTWKLWRWATVALPGSFLLFLYSWKRDFIYRQIEHNLNDKNIHFTEFGYVLLWFYWLLSLFLGVNVAQSQDTLIQDLAYSPVYIWYR